MFHNVSNALGVVIWYGGILQPDLLIQSSLCNHCSLLYCLGRGRESGSPGLTKACVIYDFRKVHKTINERNFKNGMKFGLFIERYWMQSTSQTLWELKELSDPYPLISGWCPRIALPGYTFELFIFVFEFKPSSTRWQYKNRVQYTYHSLFTAVLVSGKRPIPLNAPQLKGRR